MEFIFHAFNVLQKVGNHFVDRFKLVSQRQLTKVLVVTLSAFVVVANNALAVIISLVVVAELCWVLSSLYGATMDELVATIEDFLNTPQFCMEKREVLQAAIGRIKSKVAASSRKVGLADALITEIAASWLYRDDDV